MRKHMFMFCSAPGCPTGIPSDGTGGATAYRPLVPSECAVLPTADGASPGKVVCRSCFTRLMKREPTPQELDPYRLDAAYDYYLTGVLEPRAGHRPETLPWTVGEPDPPAVCVRVWDGAPVSASYQLCNLCRECYYAPRDTTVIPGVGRVCATCFRRSRGTA